MTQKSTPKLGQEFATKTFPNDSKKNPPKIQNPIFIFILIFFQKSGVGGLAIIKNQRPIIYYTVF